MSVSVKRIIVLLVITLALAGCATVTQLPKPLPKGSRIAVITNFRDQALFQRAGTMTADNASFYRRISGFHINPYLTTIVANDLYKSRQFRVLPIYHHPDNDLLSINVSKKRRVTPQFKSFLSQLIAGKRIDTIVLIVPDTIDFGGGQYFGPIWRASAYGLFNRAFVFIQTNIVFAAYKVYVINAHTYQLLASSSGSFEKRAHGVDVAWGKGYAGVSQRTLRVINNTLKKEMPGHLTAVVHQTGLP